MEIPFKYTPPTELTALDAINEFKQIEQSAFLEKYANGRGARDWFILHEDKTYDMKAIWAAAHRPPRPCSDFNTTEPRAKLPQMGFEILSAKEARAFNEGKRVFRESSYFRRHPALTAAAKKHYGFKCMVCDFDFEKEYGALGKNYIECHHLIPMAEDDEREKTVKDVAVVCSNCHRMIHLGGKCRKIADLKKIMRQARQGYNRHIPR